VSGATEKQVSGARGQVSGATEKQVSGVRGQVSGAENQKSEIRNQKSTDTLVFLHQANPYAQPELRLIALDQDSGFGIQDSGAGEKQVSGVRAQVSGAENQKSEIKNLLTRWLSSAGRTRMLRRRRS
jgi:hypothetical protein